MPLLEIRHLNKSFAQTPVLQDICLSLEKGEILFLLGASGCGKTTLLRAIAGFEQPDSGEIWLQSNCIFSPQHNVPTQQRRLGYVVQEGVLFPHLNVYRNIAYGLGDGKGKKEAEQKRIATVMDLTGISTLAQRFPHQLSGGQQQRVALARALAPNPPLILLDEPFSALDEHLRQQIRYDMLQALRQSESSAIFVTHDRGEALRYADKIAVMQQGNILQIDSPRTLYWQPNQLETALFMGESLLLPATQTRPHYAQSALGELPIVDKSFGNPRGQLLLRPSQFSLVKSPQNLTACWQAKVQKVEFKGRSTAISVIINEVELVLESDYPPEIVAGEMLPVYLNGQAVFY